MSVARTGSRIQSVLNMYVSELVMDSFLTPEIAVANRSPWINVFGDNLLG